MIVLVVFLSAFMKFYREENQTVKGKREEEEEEEKDEGKKVKGGKKRK